MREKGASVFGEAPNNAAEQTRQDKSGRGDEKRSRRAAGLAESAHFTVKVEGRGAGGTEEAGPEATMKTKPTRGRTRKSEAERRPETDKKRAVKRREATTNKEEEEGAESVAKKQIAGKGERESRERGTQSKRKRRPTEDENAETTEPPACPKNGRTKQAKNCEQETQTDNLRGWRPRALRSWRSRLLLQLQRREQLSAENATLNPCTVNSVRPEAPPTSYLPPDHPSSCLSVSSPSSSSSSFPSSSASPCIPSSSPTSVCASADCSSFSASAGTPSCVSPLHPNREGEGRLSAAHAFEAFTYTGAEGSSLSALRGTPVKRRNGGRSPMSPMEGRCRGGAASAGPEERHGHPQPTLGGWETPVRPRRDSAAPATVLPSVQAATAVAALRGGACIRENKERRSVASTSHDVSGTGSPFCAPGSSLPRSSVDLSLSGGAAPSKCVGVSISPSLSPSNSGDLDKVASPTEGSQRNSILAFWEEIDRRRTLSPSEVAATFTCPVCGIQGMRFVTGRYGAFLGCSSFPACRGKRSGREVELWRAGGPAGHKRRNAKLTLTCEMESCSSFRVHAQGDSEVGELLRLALPSVIQGAAEAFWKKQRGQAKDGETSERTARFREVERAEGPKEEGVAEQARGMQMREGDSQAEAPASMHYRSSGARMDSEDRETFTRVAGDAVDKDNSCVSWTRDEGYTCDSPHECQRVQRDSRDTSARNDIPDLLRPLSWLPRVDRLKSRKAPWAAFLPFICRAGEMWRQTAGDGSRHLKESSSRAASDRLSSTRGGSNIPTDEGVTERRQSVKDDLLNSASPCDESLLRMLLAGLPGGERRTAGDDCTAQRPPDWDWTVGCLAPPGVPLVGLAGRAGVREPAEGACNGRNEGDAVDTFGEFPGDTKTDKGGFGSARERQREATETGVEDTGDLPYVDGCVFVLEAYEWIISSLVEQTSEWCHVAPIPGLTLRFFREYHDRTGERENAFFVGDHQTALAIANHRMPPLLRKSLFPFQLEGILFALQRGGRVLIGDQMGLGKTIQALALLSIYKAFPVLIVVPASLRLVWAEAIERWLPSLSCPSALLVIFGSDDRPALPAPSPVGSPGHVPSCFRPPVSAFLEPSASGNSPPLSSLDLTSPLGLSTALPSASALPIKSTVLSSRSSPASLASPLGSSPPAAWAPSGVAPAEASQLPASPQIVLTSYEMTRRLPDFLSQMNFQMVIVDESHKLRTPASAGAVSGLEADMTRRVLQLIKAATYAVLLTGTPSVKHPFDLFSQIDALRPPMEPQAWRQRQARVRADWARFRREAETAGAPRSRDLRERVRGPAGQTGAWAEAEEEPGWRGAVRGAADWGNETEGGERAGGRTSFFSGDKVGRLEADGASATAAPDQLKPTRGEEKAARCRRTSFAARPRRYAHEGNILRADRIQFGEEYCTSVLTYGSRKRYGISARSWELHLLLTTAVLIRRRHLSSWREPGPHGKPGRWGLPSNSSAPRPPGGDAGQVARASGGSGLPRRVSGAWDGEPKSENGDTQTAGDRRSDDGRHRRLSGFGQEKERNDDERCEGFEGGAAAGQVREDEQAWGRPRDDAGETRRKAEEGKAIQEDKEGAMLSPDGGDCLAVPPPCIRILQALQLTGENQAIHAIAVATVLRRPPFSSLCQEVQRLCDERQKSAKDELARQTEAQLGLGKRTERTRGSGHSAKGKTRSSAGRRKGASGDKVGGPEDREEAGGAEPRGRELHSPEKRKAKNDEECGPGKRRKTDEKRPNDDTSGTQQRQDVGKGGRAKRENDPSAGRRARLVKEERDATGDAAIEVNFEASKDVEHAKCSGAEDPALSQSTKRYLKTNNGNPQQTEKTRRASQSRGKAPTGRPVPSGVHAGEEGSNQSGTTDANMFRNNSGAGRDTSVDDTAGILERLEGEMPMQDEGHELGGGGDIRSALYLRAVEKIADALGGSLDRWTVKTEAERVGLSKVKSALQWLREKFLRDDAEDDEQDEEEGNDDEGNSLTEEPEFDGSQSTKIVIFAHHRRVLDCLEQGLRSFQKRSERGGRPGGSRGRCRGASELANAPALREAADSLWEGDSARRAAFGFVRIDGSVPEEEKFRRREIFHKVPQCKIALLSVTASSHGVDLSNANVCVFVELLPEQHELLQAEGRLQRRGQRRQVTTFFLINRFLGEDADAEGLGAESAAEGDSWRLLTSDAETTEAAIDASLASPSCGEGSSSSLPSPRSASSPVSCPSQSASLGTKSEPCTRVRLRDLLTRFWREVLREKKRLLAECENLDVSAWRRYSACAAAIHHVVDGPTEAAEGDTFPLKIHQQAEWVGAACRGESEGRQTLNVGEESEQRREGDKDAGESEDQQESIGSEEAKQTAVTAGSTQYDSKSADTTGRNWAPERGVGAQMERHENKEASSCRHTSNKPVFLETVSTTVGLLGTVTETQVANEELVHGLKSRTTPSETSVTLPSISPSNKTLDRRRRPAFCLASGFCSGSGDSEFKSGSIPEISETQPELHYHAQSLHSGMERELGAGEADDDNPLATHVAPRDLRFIVSPYTKRVHVLRVWNTRDVTSRMHTRSPGHPSPSFPSATSSSVSPDSSDSVPPPSPSSEVPSSGPVPPSALDSQAPSLSEAPHSSLSFPGGSSLRPESLAPLPVDIAGQSFLESQTGTRCVSFARDACLAVEPLGISFPAEELLAPGAFPGAVSCTATASRISFSEVPMFCATGQRPEVPGRAPGSGASSDVLWRRSGPWRKSETESREGFEDMVKGYAARFYAEYLSLTSYQRRKLRNVYAPLGLHAWIASGAVLTAGKAHAAGASASRPICEGFAGYNSPSVLQIVSPFFSEPFHTPRTYHQGQAPPYEDRKDVAIGCPRQWPVKLPRSFRDLPLQAYFETMLHMHYTQCMRRSSLAHLGEKAAEGQDSLATVSGWGTPSDSNYFVPSRYYMLAGETPTEEAPGLGHNRARAAGKAPRVGLQESRECEAEARTEPPEGDGTKGAQRASAGSLAVDASRSCSPHASQENATETHPFASAKPRRSDALRGSAALRDGSEHAVKKRKGREPRRENPKIQGDGGPDGMQGTVAKARTGGAGPRSSGGAPDLRWDEDEEEDGSEGGAFDETLQRRIPAPALPPQSVSVTRGLSSAIPATSTMVPGVKEESWRGADEPAITGSLDPSQCALSGDGEGAGGVETDRALWQGSAHTYQRKRHGSTKAPAYPCDAVLGAAQSFSDDPAVPLKLTTSRFFPPSSWENVALPSKAPSSLNSKIPPSWGRIRRLTGSSLSSETKDGACTSSDDIVESVDTVPPCPSPTPSVSPRFPRVLSREHETGGERVGVENRLRLDRYPKEEHDCRLAYVRALATYSRLGGSCVTYYQPVFLGPSRPTLRVNLSQVDVPLQTLVDKCPLMDSLEEASHDGGACSSPPQPLCLMCYQPLVALSTTRKWSRKLTNSGRETKAKCERPLSGSGTPQYGVKADGDSEEQRSLMLSEDEKEKDQESKGQKADCGDNATRSAMRKADALQGSTPPVGQITARGLRVSKRGKGRPKNELVGDGVSVGDLERRNGLPVYECRTQKNKADGSPSDGRSDSQLQTDDEATLALHDESGSELCQRGAQVIFAKKEEGDAFGPCHDMCSDEWEVRCSDNDLFCSGACRAAFFARRNSDSLRRQVFRSDRGICSGCGIDCVALLAGVKSMREEGRNAAAIGEFIFSFAPTFRAFPTLAALLIREPVDGNAWHADHIIPVHQGGGLCDLTNVQTLCRACHQLKTNRETSLRAHRSWMARQAGLSTVENPLSLTQ
ncbi:SWI2/SNF2-containing protein [Toxoplasma gondii ME49]|uniref:SWI2/SNF2-containing protein n=1 Tax=Toxoplasma gondii (strain ATCC 50611 / Me49) TaxID=508771 RepID=S8GA72_TOXGM|nr:SWI2/SNF2-containing protein [Toxoplasma gondii ME49]EPT28685.1 SWI2/SNF2-containing protein [Toxoplasma gondii ME49]|eukprot:XP_018636737.1 SWI2/SNF2-containing protein [Toxoplasma gondii ME49]